MNLLKGSEKLFTGARDKGDGKQTQWATSSVIDPDTMLGGLHRVADIYSMDGIIGLLKHVS